jgi:hypothetical protein
MLPILIEALATNEAITLLFQTILIVGMLSFLWKTNPYYTVTEQMMIGGRTAVFFLVMLEGILAVFGDIAAGMVWRIIPMVMGALFFVGLTRIRWAGRYPNAIITGGGLGVLFGLSLRAHDEFNNGVSNFQSRSYIRFYYLRWHSPHSIILPVYL